MSEYGPLSRLLHHLALGAPMIGEAAFDAEWATQGRDAPDSTQAAHVFVAGLARAGTTVLMRALYQTGEFASLTYRDMPFVLAPNLWAKTTQRSRREREAAERAHGDGLTVDFDSPEALEEVFWRTFCGADYIQPDRLTPHTVDADTRERLQRYVALILKRYGRTRYLSKNNNNILRLDAIQQAFPKATVLVPFRDPYQHAYSLLRQHDSFCQRHREDAFSRRYMTWLVHHEFGGDHRPFAWGRALAGDHTPDTLAYWLAQWVGVYEHLLDQIPDDNARVIFVGYDLLCEQTDTVWRALAERVSLAPDWIPDLRGRRSATPACEDSALSERAEALFDRLSKRSRTALDR